MNVLFVYSLNDIYTYAKPLRTPEQMHLGISYISSFLKKYGHRTRLVVLSKVSGKKNKDMLGGYMKGFQPKLICFTAVASEYYFIKDIAKYIKNRYPNIYLLIGGPHASLDPEEVLKDDFDALCIGEGENATLELISELEKGMPPSGIPNLWIKRGLEIEKNPPRPFLQELDNLPFPDREMWQEWIEEQPQSSHPVLLGRGCPFECTYCCNPALKNLASGTYVRFRSPDNIVEEIKKTAARFAAKKDFNLEVESFEINKEWAMELCSKLEELNKTLSYPLTFRVNLRVTPGANFESLFIACKKSNFKMVRIGLESGSERVRREILRRNYSNQDIINAVKLARKYGLSVVFYNMIGIPGETISDFKETVRINRICLPDQHFTSIFFPYPGTDLYALCQKQGLIKKTLDTEMERNKATLSLPGFSKRQIQKSFILFDYYVYKGRKPIFKILDRVLVSVFLSNSYLYRFYRILRQIFILKWLKKVIRGN